MVRIAEHKPSFLKGYLPDDMPAEVDGISTEGLFEFCFYDADHTYAGVKAHLQVVPQWMAPGSFIICHEDNIEQARGMTEGAAEVGLLDCGMITRCVNDVSTPGELYGGLRLLKVPGELSPNS